jgi:acetyl/propionyl-CoA carboxylase alpha subunit
MSRPGRYVVREHSTATTVEVLPDHRVRVGDTAPMTVTPMGGSRYAVSDGTRTWYVRVTGPPDQRFVCTGGVAACLEIEAEGQAPPRKARAGHGDTVAPMPATVLEIVVSIGQHVAAGDVLLKLEAMKMELPVRAPRDGTVTAIRCNAGELVQPGVPLVELA